MTTSFFNEPPTLKARLSNVWVERLSKLAVLSDEDAVVLRRLTSRTQSFRAYHELVNVDRSDVVLVVLDGFACRYRQVAVGKRQNLAYLVPGDMSDLSQRGEDKIGGLSSGIVACVSQGPLQDAIERHPQIGVALAAAKTIEDAVTREWLLNIGSRSAMQRIAHLFCEMLVRLEAVSLVSEATCTFPVSQAELSASLGLSPVHINRSLQTLRKVGMIELRHRTLRILNRKELQECASFKPDYLRHRSLQFAD